MIKKMAIALYTVLGIVTMLCLVGLFFQDQYVLIPIKEYWNILTTDSPRSESKLVISLYYTILMGVFTAYFTVLSIILSRKEDLSFFSFFKYTKSYDFLISTLLSLIICTTILFFNRFSYLIEIYFSISIVICFIEFLVSLLKISYLENQKQCADLLYETIVKAKKNKNINKVKNFIKDFAFICFPHNVFSLFEFTNKKWKRKNSENKEIELFYLDCYKIVVQSINDRQLYIEFLNGLIKKSYEKIGKDKIDYDLIKKIYENIFEMYRNILLFGGDFPSQILKIKEPLFFKLIEEKHNPSEDLVSLFNYVLNESYRLISYSLYSCSFNTINTEIHEYSGMVQFFDLYNNLKDIVSLNEQHLIDIAIRIVNVVQVGKANNKLLKLISPLLDNIKSIKIFDGETELYDELLASTDVHEVYFTRNYFLSLMLVYYGSCNSNDKLSGILTKLEYIRSNNSFDEKYKYSYILSELNKISAEPQKAGSVIDIRKKNVFSSLNYLKNLLKEKISDIDARAMQELRITNVDENLNKSISDEKINIIDQFTTAGLRKQKKNDEIFYILKSNFIFSKRVLLNDKSIIMCGMRYSEYLLPYLYGRFLSLSTKIIINRLEEIKYLRKGDKLLISSNLMTHIYSNYKINFSDNTIIVKNKSIYFDWFSTKSNYIFIEKNFNNTVSIPEVIAAESGRTEKEEANDIQINVDYQLKFSYSNSAELKFYELII